MRVRVTWTLSPSMIREPWMSRASIVAPPAACRSPLTVASAVPAGTPVVAAVGNPAGGVVVGGAVVVAGGVVVGGAVVVAGGVVAGGLVGGAVQRASRAAFVPAAFTHAPYALASMRSSWAAAPESLGAAPAQTAAPSSTAAVVPNATAPAHQRSPAGANRAKIFIRF